jgi:hypothetical protein
MGGNSQNAGAKCDEIYQEAKRRILADDHDGFWRVIHDCENEHLREGAKLILVWY